jgi:RNA polymerase sigma-70 factor (sigma-E family)
MHSAERDDESFAAFVTQSQRGLHHLAWLLTGDGHRAEELVQDALVRTYASWHKVRRDDPYGYTRRVLINAKTDTWRRRRREQLVDVLPEGHTPAPDHADAVERRTTVVTALRTLSPRERAVVVLRYYLDLSEAATAAELGMAVGTVKSTASRALAKLRVAPETGESATRRDVEDRRVAIRTEGA